MSIFVRQNLRPVPGSINCPIFFQNICPEIDFRKSGVCSLQPSSYAYLFSPMKLCEIYDSLEHFQQSNPSWNQMSFSWLQWAYLDLGLKIQILKSFKTLPVCKYMHRKLIVKEKIEHKMKQITPTLHKTNNCATANNTLHGTNLGPLLAKVVMFIRDQLSLIGPTTRISLGTSCIIIELGPKSGSKVWAKMVYLIHSNVG